MNAEMEEGGRDEAGDGGYDEQCQLGGGDGV